MNRTQEILRSKSLSRRRDAHVFIMGIAADSIRDSARAIAERWIAAVIYSASSADEGTQKQQVLASLWLVRLNIIAPLAELQYNPAKSESMTVVLPSLSPKGKQ